MALVGSLILVPAHRCPMQAVAIGGSSGSGKTRLAAEIAALVDGAGVLCTDAYYRDRSGVPCASRAHLNFDVPDALDWDLLDLHLRRLRAGRPVNIPLYDFATHTRAAAGRPFRPCRILLLEGLFALCEPRVREFVDLAVFVDAPEALCLSRRLARDTAMRGRSEASVRHQWHRDVVPMYRRHVLPARAGADLVIDGSRDPLRSARAVLRALRARMVSKAPVSLGSGL